MEDVTDILNEILAQQGELASALAALVASPFLGRETVSTALGEISEHLVALATGGNRVKRALPGFDVQGIDGTRIEVKSRQLGTWGEDLMFDLSHKKATADIIYCIAWNDIVSPIVIHMALKIACRDFVRLWSTPEQKRYLARTDLKKIRKSLSEVGNYILTESAS
jgi:hypothetical protein